MPTATVQHIILIGDGTVKDIIYYYFLACLAASHSVCWQILLPLNSTDKRI